MNFFGDPFGKASSWSEENEIGALWSRFTKFRKSNPSKIKNIRFPDCTFQAHFVTAATIETGLFDVFAGVSVTHLEDIPIECVAKQLPETSYAIYTLKGQEIISYWGTEILKNWYLTEYEISYHYSLLCYDKRLKGMKDLDSSEMDVYIPVKKKNI